MKKVNRFTCGEKSAGITAVQGFYKLCGESQPSVLRGSDGAFYVVKFDGFPGRSQGLLNEVVGTELIRRMGLPAPDWVRIEVSDEFIERNPKLWFCTGGGSAIKPKQGIHFGSRLIEGPDEQRTYRDIPNHWIEKVENRTDFLGVLVLDLWANSCDRRQAVYLGEPEQELHATFIDNDYMFGGKSGNDTTCPRRAMVPDLDMYKGLWNTKDVQKWLQKIDGIDDDETRQIVASVPDAWADDTGRSRILDMLRTRRSRLSSLLNEAKDVLASGHSVKLSRARNATEPDFCYSSILSIRK